MKNSLNDFRDVSFHLMTIAKLIPNREKAPKKVCPNKKYLPLAWPDSAKYFWPPTFLFLRTVESFILNLNFPVRQPVPYLQKLSVTKQENNEIRKVMWPKIDPVEEDEMVVLS